MAYCWPQKSFLFRVSLKATSATAVQSGEIICHFFMSRFLSRVSTRVLFGSQDHLPQAEPKLSTTTRERESFFRENKSPYTFHDASMLLFSYICNLSSKRMSVACGCIVAHLEVRFKIHLILLSKLSGEVFFFLERHV